MTLKRIGYPSTKYPSRPSHSQREQVGIQERAPLVGYRLFEHNRHISAVGGSGDDG